MKKRMKPSHGNITILGTGGLVKKMEEFGQMLADRLQDIIRVRVGVLILDAGASKRLTLSICKDEMVNTSEEAIKKMGFDIFLFEDKVKSCLRLWGFPIEFISPQAEKIRGEWKDIFNFSARIDRTGSLALSVSSADDDEEMLSQFRVKLAEELSIPCGVSIRDKQKHRKGNPVPGFIVVFPISLMKKENQQNSGLVDQQLTSEVKTLLAQEDLPVGVPPDKLIELAVAYLPIDDRISLVKSLLPEGVGLYNKNNPFTIDGGAAKVNSL